MRKNYNELTQRIQTRLNPERIPLAKAFTEELTTLSYSDVLIYIRTAMKGVEPEYTKKSRLAGDKVKEHLMTVLSDVEYKYQGSVMTDTHIKGHSDIDLLTICDKFYSWDRTEVINILESANRRLNYGDASIRKMESVNNASSYSGNALYDLWDIRTKSEGKLSEVYQECDTTKPKSIKITNKSLNRDVDIVTANWYDDVRSIILDGGDNRGIQVYNKDLHQKGSPDYPFTSISRINSRSSETNGRLKKMIRFLKHCKADSGHEIKLSSFDINAICYDLKTSEYEYLAFYDLVPVLYKQLKDITTNDIKADSIVSVDGREYIFKGDFQKKQNLRLLLSEVEGVYLDLLESRLLRA